MIAALKEIFTISVYALGNTQGWQAMFWQFLVQIGNFLPVLFVGCLTGYIAAFLLGDDRTMRFYTLLGALAAVTGPIFIFAALGYEKTMSSTFSMIGLTAGMGFALGTIFLYSQIREILE